MNTNNNESTQNKKLMMGNEAIARGVMEAGVSLVAGYPGTPASDIVENLLPFADSGKLYVEWSVNEKVALEVAASGSFAGLRSLAVMKQPGLNVASDFLLHLSGSGTRAGMVLISADDPGALSSVNEGETRYYAKLMEVPLLEPGTFQEVKDMTKWAFELSEELKNLVLVRTVTRLSHGSGMVSEGEIPANNPQAYYKNDGFILDPMEGVVMSPPVDYKHGQQQVKLSTAVNLFEDSPFNTYTGPEKPELLIITSSICFYYAREAVEKLNLNDRVGILKLGTTWPLPPKLVKKHLKSCDKVLVVEEVLPFLEDELKILAAESVEEIGVKTFFGKKNKLIPSVGEMNPDKVIDALISIFQIEKDDSLKDYQQKALLAVLGGAPHREATFCAGCPHRASFWSINTALSMDNRNGFVCGDIGCYSMAVISAGFSSLKTLHAMGSGSGIGSGFGKLKQFGMDQPVTAVCGDSTFFHSVMPPLANAIHNNSDMTLIVLDNSGTAMTGFQPHPGTLCDAAGNAAAKLDIPEICRAMGAEVFETDPFDISETRKMLLNVFDGSGVRVVVMKQSCALSPEKKQKRRFYVSVDESKCAGENCGCNRICTRIFACPGLFWDEKNKKTEIDPVMCSGCGVCASVCPQGAILKTEAN